MSPERYASDKIIHIAAAVINNEERKLLLVRKAGTMIFMQPGGKIMSGESALEALRRELSEELALEVDPAEPTYLGCVTAEAANERGFVVEAQLFHIFADAEVRACCEIEELVWVSAADARDLPLAPLTRLWVLPFVEGRTN